MKTQSIYQTDINQLKIVGLKSVILDMDGVITQTAKLHMTAWKEMFNNFLKQRDKDFKPFTDKDYFNFVDGKPRLNGIRSFLESRNINLPEGMPDDSIHDQSVNGLGNIKNKLFLKMLHERGVDTYKDTVQQIKHWRQHGIKTAVISSSTNCKEILESAGILKLFDARVDGEVSIQKGIKGKPEPDIFIEAAKALNSSPNECVVFEDAISGVQAASRGNFALVIGVNRQDSKKSLYENGADIVIENLEEIDLFNNSKIEPYFTQTLPSAFTKQLKYRSLTGNKTPVLFLDYDGTLSPIVNEPDNATLSKEMKETLEKCSQSFTVAVVSGRDMDDLKKKINIENIIYAGSHGFRISGPDKLYMEHEKTPDLIPQLDQIEQELNQTVNDIAGVEIDRKLYAIGVHYRNADAKDEPEVIERVNNLLKRYPDFKNGGGKKLAEIRPNIDWHKGKALKWIMDKLNLSEEQRYLPVYIGDDVTDEDAFKILSHKGIGILVGFHNQLSAARYSLKNVYQVRLFLNDLANSKKTIQ